MKPQKLCHLNKQNQTLHELNSLKYSMKLSTKKSPTPTINYANQSQSRCMWGVIPLPEYLQTQQTKGQHAKYSKWMVSHTLCNNTHPPTILRFTINVCNNQSKSLHVQNEKGTNNEACNEHTPTTMLHEFILNNRLKNTLILNWKQNLLFFVN